MSYNSGDILFTIPTGHGTAAVTVREVVHALRARGSLILAPSDTSPLGELVRAAVEAAQAPRMPAPTKEVAWLLDAADAVSADPAVRAWIERGRDG